MKNRYPARQRIPKVMKENVNSQNKDTEKVKVKDSTTNKGKKRKTLEVKN